MKELVKLKVFLLFAAHAVVVKYVHVTVPSVTGFVVLLGSTLPESPPVAHR